MDPNEQQQPPAGDDAPDAQKMAQIRARRLAKLGGPPAPASSHATQDSQTPGNTTQSSGAASSTPSQNPPGSQTPAKINIAPARTDTPRSSASQNSAGAPPAANPFTKLGVSASDAQSSPGTAPSLGERKRKTAATDADSAPAAPRRANPPPVESDEDYAHRILSQVFRISVDPHVMTNAQGQRLAFLAGINEQLNEEGQPLKLSVDVLSQAVMEAASMWPQDKPLMEYLLPCWKRSVKAANGAKTATGDKLIVLEEAKRLAMSNCLFALAIPDLFGREANAHHDSLVPYLLRGVQDEYGLDMDFISEAIKRFDEDEAYPELFTHAMVEISARLSRMEMDEDYKPYISALMTYTRFPPLITNLAQHPTFNPQLPEPIAPTIELRSLLGPFFRISPLQAKAIKSYFPGARSLDRARITNAQDSLRMVLRTHQEDLFVIANAFIRNSAETRSKTLDWFAYIMNTNHKRRAMQSNPVELASDGFMMNITTILDRFCEPFMDNDFSKVDKIDVRYFQRSPRVDVKDETKINADQAASDQFFAKKQPGESNFISEAFFLTLAAHHYGSEAVNARFKSLDSQIKYLERQLKAMEGERPRLAHSPHHLRVFEETFKKHSNVLEKAMALKYAIEGALLDERMQSTSLRFMRYVAVWLLRLATRSNYKPGFESQEIKLPLEVEESDAFSCLPEYALQNIVDNFKFIFRYLPRILPSAVGDELIALCITLLRSSEYIKNPYLKSSLVSLLFSGTWPFMHLKKGVLGDQLTGSKFANDYLLHSLMKFYIECESTGAHTQFYDKFNIRYEIFQVIKCVWGNDVYKQELRDKSKVNKDFFVRFVNMLLNDATYVLDEAFTKFPKMRQLEVELEDRSLSAEDRQKKEEELNKLGEQAKSYMQLANETLEMMKLFTEALSEAFTMPEIVQRLASMLNYNLETLAGKRAAADLNVRDRDKYHFRPVQLLSDFVEIYLNLGASSRFVDAVAADGRCYKPEVLSRVSTILVKKHQRDPSDIARFDVLCQRFLTAKQLIDQAEADIGEIPDEFEDPLLGILMEDPVLLPSKHIVDRSTIMQHLLSDPKDPFTRQPMGMEDVVEQEALREKVAEWKRERMEAAKQRLQAAKGDAMDTSE